MIYVVGHRGAAGVLPENTLKGFRYAIDLGVDQIECDVHRTRDDRLVVIHDDTVDRTTNGHGAIREMNFAAIRALDAGQGEQVPTLDEVLATVQGKVGLLCELKGEGVEDATVDAVVAHGMEQEVIFTSFHLERLARVRQRGAHFRLGAILPNPTDAEIAQALDLGVVGINVYYKNLCLRLVEQIHAAGRTVRAWNPDTLREQQAMIALGADSVGTNRPDILMAYLREQGQR
jgi:glycerophosphoryl diester phosphodiesterase